MRAATYRRYGAPDVLTVEEVPRPALGARQILVEVRASVVTQGDRRLRSADFPGISAVFGRLMFGLRGPRAPIPGSMFAGRVAEVGAEVTRFEVGDDVFGSVMGGAHAEYLAVAEDEAVATMPVGLDYAEAAAIPYGAGTALTFLRDLARVQPGERVLVVGASGGVGRFAVQIAKHLGAEVTGVASRDLDRVRALGADRVIDYTREDYTRGDARYDVIFDTTESGRWSRARGRLTPRGRYLSLYLTLGMVAAMAWTALRRGPRAIAGVAMANAAQMEELRALAEAGAIRPILAARYPLGRVANAHVFLERSRPWGSVSVEVGAPGERRAPVHGDAAATPIGRPRAVA